VSSAGWDDHPPDRLDPSVPDGIKLIGDEPRVRRARRVYHAALADSIKERGGRTAERMLGRLGWFHLRYTAKELQNVLKSARRYDVIETPGSSTFDDRVTGDVRLTSDGKRLTPPRGASVADFRHVATQTTALMWDVIAGAEKPVARLAALVAGLGVVGAWASGNWRLLAWVAWLWIVIAQVLVAKNELELKAAAQTWPRLKQYREHRYAWETHAWRHWFFPVVRALVAGLVACAVFVWQRPASYWLSAASAGVAAVGLAIYFWKVGPLRRRWLAEARRVRPELYNRRT
jgi:hypothetical protein